MNPILPPWVRNQVLNKTKTQISKNQRRMALPSSSSSSVAMTGSQRNSSRVLSTKFPTVGLRPNWRWSRTRMFIGGMYSSSFGNIWKQEGRKEMFYLTMHSTHFIYGYMASDIWLRTILIVRKETHCRHRGYSFRSTARVLLYAPSDRQDSTYHSLCYTSRGALAGTRNSSVGPTHEGSI